MLNGNSCDTELQNNAASRAMIGMHCQIAPGQPAVVLPHEITRLGANHLQSKVPISNGTFIVHEYQRTKTCTPAH